MREGGGGGERNISDKSRICIAELSSRARALFLRPSPSLSFAPFARLFPYAFSLFPFVFFPSFRSSSLLRGTGRDSANERLISRVKLLAFMAAISTNIRAFTYDRAVR